MKAHLLMFFAAGMLTGCHERAHHADDDPPTTMPAPTVEHSTKEIRSHVQDAPVQSGPPPLAYIVESAANVRVVDVTTNETLATAPCRAQAIVSVDPAGGVRIGDSVIVKGPLPRDHHYSIYLDADDTSHSRTTWIRPGTAGEKR